MLPYPINLVGWSEATSGDVVTRDGEYLGRWHTDPEDHPSFVPDGHSEIVFYELFLGELCGRIQEWAEMSREDREKLLEESRAWHEEFPEEAAYALGNS